MARLRVTNEPNRTGLVSRISLVTKSKKSLARRLVSRKTRMLGHSYVEVPLYLERVSSLDALSEAVIFGRFPLWKHNTSDIIKLAFTLPQVERFVIMVL
ncbi:hypothetical protein CDAR_445181 [Caerostris darwini]|uniref:Uncharacterized protein n=1 Tax=Caerostris darwini TaxID=1538125 RepID=A0AAV4SC83_9ARAC|nr:hypothetical protein CDAR_445181 [Caerostris darwini]